MHSVVVLGTRPELIKMAAVIRFLGNKVTLVHTGQHYHENLHRRIMEDLGTDTCVHQINTPPTSRGKQLGTMVSALDDFLSDRPPSSVVVQGDTTSALSGALAANARGLPLVHVEAGLRSHDRAMPEEHNRVLIDHLADVCCTHSGLAHDNLLREGIPESRIRRTGNPIIDVLEEILPSQEASAAFLQGLGLTAGRYVLATFHRPENVDNPEALRSILTELTLLPCPVILPCHPRTARRIEQFGLEHLAGALEMVPSLAYSEFLSLARSAALIVSDSGGLQEEVSVLKRPIVVVRSTTERPEILGAFGTLTSWQPDLGAVIKERLSVSDSLHEELARLPSPFGDGRASERIVEVVTSLA